MDLNLDFSEIWDSNDLRQHFFKNLDSKMEGDRFYLTNKKPLFLEMSSMVRNIESAGSSCLTYIRKIENISISVKYYNKIVSNLEIADLRGRYGAHFYEYVDCPEPCVRKLMKEKSWC